MPEILQTKKTWLGPLDGVRGTLALWVMFAHVSSLTGTPIPIVSNGALAVDLFMVVSGILMAHHYWDREHAEPWNSSRTWLLFYLRRFFRIAPLYYIALALNYSLRTHLLALRAELSNYDQAIATTLPNVSLPVEVLSHVTFTFGLFPKLASLPLLPDWSIGLEMQFYLAFPFLMLFARRFGYVTFAILSVLISLLSLKLFWGVYTLSEPKLLGLYPQPTLLPMKTALFASGILVATGIRLEGSKAIILSIFALVCATIGQATIVTVGVAVTLLALLGNRTADGTSGKDAAIGNCVGRILSSRPANWIADLSFSIYLLHNLILIPVVWLLNQSEWFRDCLPIVRWGIACASVTTAVLPISMAINHIVERPGIALGRKVIQFISAKGSTA